MINEEKERGSIRFSNIVVWQSDYSFVWIESYFNKSNALLNAAILRASTRKIFFISLLQEIIHKTPSNYQIKMRRDR